MIAFTIDECWRHSAVWRAVMGQGSRSGRLGPDYIEGDEGEVGSWATLVALAAPRGRAAETQT